MRQPREQQLPAKTSCDLNRRSENVAIKPIIVPELELRNVKMQVFHGNVGECADDAALEYAPKAFNRVGMSRADDILPLRVVDSGVRITGLAKTVVANPLIGA